MGIEPGNVELPPRLFERVACPIVFHNAKFDLHVLKKAGLIIPYDKVYDTMLMSHLIYEERLSHGLNDVARDYLGVQKEVDLAKAMKNFEWEEVPPHVMAKYAEQDAKVTWELYLHMKPHFEPYEKVWETDRDFMFLLQMIEQRGLGIDVELCKQLEAECVIRLEKLKSELGFDPAKTKALKEKLFSLPPVGYGLKPKTFTPGGQPQVNTRFLQETPHPVCDLLLSFKETQKQLTSYYRSYLRLGGEDYGRIHASFKQHGTVTGRLSCADPNMQQIPRDSPIKQLFLPEVDKQLWEIDFRNIEMRLAAVYSQEPILLETFASEGDVHQLTADLLGITRQFAKTINFLVIYGGGAEALAYQLRIPYKQAKTIHDQFKRTYLHLFRFMDKCTEETHAKGGVIRMWSGRYRHFRFKSDYHKAFNAIVQGGAFEIVKRSMLGLNRAGFDIRNQVHDSVWLMVNDELDVIRAEKVMSEWTLESFGLNFSVDRKRLG